MDIKITFETLMTLNERFRSLKCDTSDDIKSELNIDIILPPRPLQDEDNFDDDHVEIFDKQLLEDELNKIYTNIVRYNQ